MKKLICLLVLLSGCASGFKPPVKADIQKKFEVNKSYEATWTSLIRMFADKNISFKTIDKSSGIIVSEEKSFSPFDNGGRLDCGTMKSTGLAQIDGRAIYNVFLEKENADKTIVTINVSSKMVSTTTVGYQSQSGAMDCHSTGKFEKEVFDFIK